LVTRYLARISAYDRQGPAIHAVISLNPAALETARALDAERKAKDNRLPLHGIPIVLKDNYDTRDLPEPPSRRPSRNSDSAPTPAAAFAAPPR